MFMQKMERKTTGTENKAIARKEKKINASRPGERVAAKNQYIWNDGAENLSVYDMTQHMWNSGKVIQREVARYKPDVPQTPDEIEFDQKAHQLDESLHRAYNEFLQGDVSGASPGYVDNYVMRMNEYKERRAAPPYMEAGSVIESKVYNRIDRDQGIRVQVADILKGTRPDIVLYSETGTKALLDITAEKSKGHILNKSGNWLGEHKEIVYVAELLYPSVDFNRMASIQLTPEERERIDQHIRERKMQEQEYLNAFRECFQENQNNILEALMFYRRHLSAKGATERQKEAVMTKFSMFGIGISFSGDQQNIDVLSRSAVGIDTFPSLSVMNTRAQEILQGIRSGTLIGMRGWQLPSRFEPF